MWRLCSYCLDCIFLLVLPLVLPSLWSKLGLNLNIASINWHAISLRPKPCDIETKASISEQSLTELLVGDQLVTTRQPLADHSLTAEVARRLSIQQANFPKWSPTGQRPMIRQTRGLQDGWEKVVNERWPSETGALCFTLANNDYCSYRVSVTSYIRQLLISEIASFWCQADVRCCTCVEHTSWNPLTTRCSIMSRIWAVDNSELPITGLLSTSLKLSYSTVEMSPLKCK